MQQVDCFQQAAHRLQLSHWKAGGQGAGTGYELFPAGFPGVSVSTSAVSGRPSSSVLRLGKEAPPHKVEGSRRCSTDSLVSNGPAPHVLIAAAPQRCVTPLRLSLQGHCYRSRTGKCERWFKPAWIDENRIPKQPLDLKALKVGARSLQWNDQGPQFCVWASSSSCHVNLADKIRPGRHRWDSCRGGRATGPNHGSAVQRPQLWAACQAPLACPCSLLQPPLAPDGPCPALQTCPALQQCFTSTVVKQLCPALLAGSA